MVLRKNIARVKQQVGLERKLFYRSLLPHSIYMPLAVAGKFFVTSLVATARA